MSNIKTIIQKLLIASKENRNSDEIQVFKNILSENIEESSKSSDFYNLPLEFLLEIIGQTHFSICNDYLAIMETLISKFSNLFPKQSALLLHYFSIDDLNITLNDCIKLFSFFTTSPLCVKLSTLYSEDISSPEYDYEYEIKQKDIMILNLQNEIKELKNAKKFKPIIKKPDIFHGTIHAAANYAHIPSIQWLIEKEKVDINEQNDKGETALYIASDDNCPYIVEYLLEHGANPNIPNNRDWTPLLKAIEHGYFDITKSLVENGADVNFRCKNGHTILHTAALNHRIEIIKYLFEHGVEKSLNAKRNDGNTPLDYALRSTMEDGPETISFLRSKGAISSK